MTKVKATVKKTIKKTTSSVDLHKEVIEEFIEKCKINGLLSYEELIAFGDKNNVTDAEVADILRLLEKEKLEKNIINLKDIIQFSEFDEDNIPKVEEEKKGLLQTIWAIRDLVENEEKIYHHYRSQLADPKKKKEMLDAVKANKEKIA